MPMGNVCPGARCFPGLQLWLSRGAQGPVTLLEPFVARENHTCVSANGACRDSLSIVRNSYHTQTQPNPHACCLCVTALRKSFTLKDVKLSPVRFMVNLGSAEPVWTTGSLISPLTQVQHTIKENKKKGQRQEPGRRKHIRINPLVSLFLFLSFLPPLFSQLFSSGANRYVEHQFKARHLYRQRENSK